MENQIQEESDSYSSSVGKRRVVVPQNELNAALSTLTNTLSATHNLHQDQLQKSVLSTFEASLKSVPPTEFESMQEFGSTPMKAQLHKAMKLNSRDDSQVLDDISVSSTSTVEFDLDESTDMEHFARQSLLEPDELVDQEVHQKAKDLRNKVRLASENLALLREEKIHEGLNRINSEVELLQQYLETVNSKTVDENVNQVGPNLQLEEMETALEKLNKKIADFEGYLPEKVQGIKDTMESVSLALKKQIEGGNLTGTEMAIRAREGGDTVWKKNLPQPSKGNDRSKTVENNPAKRFALFMSKHS